MTENPSEEPVIKITLTSVYSEVMKQSEANARIEGKLDLTNVQLATMIETVSDHESRIRNLENHPSQTVSPQRVERIEQQVIDLDKSAVSKAMVGRWLAALSGIAVAIGTVLMVFH